MAYWLFQANPRYSRVLDGLRDLAEMYWLVTRYTREISPGDRVVIWVAGPQAGIYALAQVARPVLFVDQPPDLDYWLLPMRAIGRFYVPVRFIRKVVDRPLLKAELRHHPGLSQLSVLRVPQGTNFRITAQEWQRIQELLGDR